MKRCLIPTLALSLLLIVAVSAWAQQDGPDTLFSAGVEAYNAKKYEEAISLWDKALPLYKKIGDIEHEAMVLNNIGLVHFYMGEYDEAVDYFSRALVIDRKRAISKDIATDLQNLGMAYYYLGGYREALSAYRESAEVFGSITDLEGEANSIYNVGKAYLALEEYAEAGRYFSAAADLHRNLRDRTSYALDIMRLGDVYAELDRFDKAMELYQEVLKVREVLGEKAPYVRTQIDIAKALEGAGRYGDALEYIDRAQEDAKDAKDDPLMGDVIAARGEVLSASGDWEGALAAYDEALSLMKKGEDLAGAGVVLTYKGILLGDLFRFLEAEKSFGEARLVYQVIGDPINEAKVLINLGSLMSAQGELENALAYLGEAQEILKKGRPGAVDGVNLMGMGEVYLKQKDYKKARPAFISARGLLSNVRDRRYAAKIDAYLGLVDYLEGNYPLALARFNTSLSTLREESAKTLVADILVGTGMALVKTKRPGVAVGYFVEAKRLADDLIIPPVGWRAVFADGLVKEGAGDTAISLARFEDALFRLTSVPEVTPSLYGGRMITQDDLCDRLAAAYRAKGETGKSDAVAKKREGMEKIASLFTGEPPALSEKEQELLTRAKDSVGEVNYLAKRLADDEYRKGNNSETFTKRILGAEGEYLKALDDIRDDAPGLWDTYFRDVYE